MSARVKPKILPDNSHPVLFALVSIRITRPENVSNHQCTGANCNFTVISQWNSVSVYLEPFGVNRAINHLEVRTFKYAQSICNFQHTCTTAHHKNFFPLKSVSPRSISHYSLRFYCYREERNQLWRILFHKFRGSNFSPTLRTPSHPE